MPALSTVAIADGAATPIVHTFNPRLIDSSGVSILEERVGGVPIGYPVITWSVRAPTKDGSTYKVTGKLSQPKVIATTDPTSGNVSKRVDYTNLATVDFVVSTKSTKQERKDLRTLMSNLLMNATVISTVDDLESIW